MDIALAAGAIEFIAYPATVTGCTLVERICAFFEFVSVNKSFFGKFGTADVATATTCVASKTVTCAGLIDLVPFPHVGSAFQDCRKG